MIQRGHRSYAKVSGRIFEKDLKPDRILDELQFYLDQPIEHRRDLVIFDEIQ